STGIEQLNRAITQMDQLTQSNSAQTEELSSTAQLLATQAIELQSLVARFKLGGQPTLDAPAAAAILGGVDATTGAATAGSRSPRTAGRRPAPVAPSPAFGDDLDFSSGWTSPARSAGNGTPAGR